MELPTPDQIYIATAILAAAGLLVVSILIGVTTRRRQEQVLHHTRFRPRKRLMEGASKRCFDLLIDLFGDKFYIIPDVALSALLNHKVGTQDRHTAYRIIENKSVDFVLCNKRSMRPICAVKLETRDDATPGNRPEDFQNFFMSAHIPFVYLSRDAKLTSETLIDEFSRVVYETSILSRRY